MNEWQLVGLMIAGPEVFSEAIKGLPNDDLDDVAHRWHELSEENQRNLWSEYDRRGISAPP